MPHQFTSATFESPSDVSPYQRWETEIDSALRELDKFHERGNYAVRKYVDERDDVSVESRFFNVYYANTNILESALYSEIPEATVTRAYEDHKDHYARVGALILQRCLQQDLNDPKDQFDRAMHACVQDRLVPGLATVWLRLETDTEDIPESEGGSLGGSPASLSAKSNGANDGFVVQGPPAAAGPDPSAQPAGPPAQVPGQPLAQGGMLPQPQPPGMPPGGMPPGQPQGAVPPPPEQIVPLKRIKQQRVIVDYVHWRDFIWSPCRIWTERRWVARRVYLTRKQLVDRFGSEKGNKCQLNWSGGKQAGKDANSINNTEPRRQVIKLAEVFEVWDRVERKVIWFSKGLPELLDEKEDFLNLQDFDPCPEPMFANVTTQNCTPRPDYYMIRDQYDELDLVNARISKLVEACKVVGVYDQSSKAVQAMLQGGENKMIPVENWGQFSEKGGMKGLVDWLPLEDIVAALERLYQARESIKAQIYELTGIADIVRGASKASETLGAQQIKAQFASIRIKKLQDEVARFASDILRKRAEIMVKHFTPEMLIRKSGISFTDNDRYIVGAVALIKSEQGFNWYVSVQPDTMSQADYDAEKQDRIEFMSAVTGYIAQTLPIVQQVPEIKPILLGLLKWGIAGFKRASDIEGMINKQLTALEGKPPPPPQPDPKVAAMQMKAQTDKEKAQQDMQIKTQEAQMDSQARQEELQFKREEAQLDRAEKQMELDFKREELQLKAQETQQNLQATMQKSQIDLQTHQQVAAQKAQDAMIQSDIKQRAGEQQLQMAERQGEQDLAQSEAAGKQKLDQSKQEAKVKRSLLVKSNPGASKRQ